MTSNKLHSECIELLLASITLTMGEDGMKHSFLFGKPGALIHEKNIAITLYYHPVELDLATLFLRGNGPKYLRSLPLFEISAKLQRFVEENIYWISDSILSSDDERSIGLWISAEEKKLLANKLSSSDLFLAPQKVNLFPLVPVHAAEKLAFGNFFFSPAGNDSIFIAPFTTSRKLDSRSFPPQPDFKGNFEYPNSWLGVFSPDHRAAMKTRSAILGALSLTCLHRYRHMFSGRRNFGGYVTIDDKGFDYAFGNNHLPPLMYDIVLTQADAKWLGLLSHIIDSDNVEANRHLKALEYFYRSWPLEPQERFPILCMAIDAIFGDENEATKSVVDGVARVFDGKIDLQQLRAIMKLRGSVIHGGAPDVYDSSKYPKYRRKFRSDPISDLELVVAHCLKQVVFKGTIVEHDDPNAKLIAEAQAAGRLPKKLKQASIMDQIELTH